MRLSRGCSALAIAALAALPFLGATAHAAPVAPGKWELLEPASPGSPGKTADPGMFRSPDGILHVAWIHQNAPLDQTLNSMAFGADGSLGTVAPVVQHWVDLADADFVDGVGGPRIFFGGQQTTVTGTPLGLMTASSAGLGWGPATQITDTYGTVSAASGPGGSTYQAFESQSTPAVHVGLAPSPLLAPTTGVAGMTEASPALSSADGGFLTVAWCAFKDNSGGIFTQKLDLATSQLSGAPGFLPGSTTGFAGKQYATCVLQSEVSRRTPIATRAGGGVYIAGTTGYPTLTGMVLWKVGGATLTADRRPGVTHQEPEVVADPSGRLWAGWVQTVGGSSVLVVRRTNRSATVFGAKVTVKSPPGATIGSFEGDATAAHLDVIGQLSSGNTNSIRHTIVLPGLTLKIVRTARRSGGRKAVTYEVTDAGDPVSGAKVTVGARSATTGNSGRVTITLKGSSHAVATKKGYTKASV